jgi:DNA-binding XRE family transcriptional regulator
MDPVFRSWRRKLGLTQAEAAAALGRSRRQIQDYDNGGEAPPRVVRLAMRAIQKEPGLKTYKFADGSDIPDDEVIMDPAVDDKYSPEPNERLAKLRDKLAAAQAEAAETGETDNANDDTA